MPLYTGGADTARIRQARYGASAAQSSLDNQLLLNNSSLASAWYLHTSLGQQLELGHKQVVAYQIVVDGQTRTNRDGLTSLQDLLRSRQSLVGAQISESQLRSSLGQDDAQLLALAGMLTIEDMGIDGETRPAGASATR
jgi:outer membrane protein